MPQGMNNKLIKIIVVDTNMNQFTYENVINEVWLDEIGMYVITTKNMIDNTIEYIKIRIAVIHNIRIISNNNTDKCEPERFTGGGAQNIPLDDLSISPSPEKSRVKKFNRE